MKHTFHAVRLNANFYDVIRHKSVMQLTGCEYASEYSTPGELLGGATAYLLRDSGGVGCRARPCGRINTRSNTTFCSDLELFTTGGELTDYFLTFVIKR